ncbi:hypothetical protein C8R43DRAFT_1118833 [Mycena crocata]|nr:hypothetical protein C8R43DRAFT_1118833 [Mycena crocata]
MNKDSSTSPSLSMDLERKILEMVAFSRRGDIPTPEAARLMRVASRVEHWLEPILYRTLVVHEKRRRDSPAGFLACEVRIFIDVLHTKSYAVRNLMLDLPTGYNSVADLFLTS